MSYKLSSLLRDLWKGIKNNRGFQSHMKTFYCRNVHVCVHENTHIQTGIHVKRVKTELTYCVATMNVHTK